MYCKVILTTAAVVLLGCSRENGVQAVAAADKAAAPSPVVSAEPAPDPEPRAAAPAPATTAEETVVHPAFLIPAGTRVRVRLAQTLDTKYSRPGSTFGATLADPIVVGNRVVVPRGTPFTGSILASKRSGRFRGRARLEITLRTFRMKGVTYHLATAPDTRVSGSHKKRNLGLMGGGSAVGAGIGALAAGGTGALIGAGAGGNDDGVFHGEKECVAAGGNADGVPDADQRSGAA